MRTDQERKILLKQLRKTPVVQIACEKSGIPRATYYRWRKSNKKFKEESDKSLNDGKKMINDLAESQLITAIKDKNFQAIKFWLTNHHKDYTNKLEVTHSDKDKELSKSQQELIKKALELTSAHKKPELKEEHENNRE
ncbi:hypothetical protein KKC45_02405 [Patescibacteria group bacterium]|nr:hypothetical protein [Patescibacteria group bacterium]